MECGESILCGSGELDLDPDIVSEEAGKLYSELQTVIETHGVGVVESLVPILVWVLEGLASCRAQLREREEEAEREKGERDELLERYQSEKLLRRESQERYLELDDQIEQERRTMRGREKERERREKELEKKAREQADQLVALEEQRAGLGRELNTLKHTHNKLVVSYKDLLERKRDIEGSPLSTPVRADAKEPIRDKTSMGEEIKEVAEKEGEKEEKKEEGAKQEMEDEDMDSLEWELRNTESVFSELSELSREYIESVDQGASVRGSTDQFEEILSQYEDLKHTHELVNAARKALISRVEELTNERSALKVEVTSCQETVTRLEGRMKEMEEETKRLRKELEANQSDDDSSLPISLRRFSRSEMSRVVMEKNQYKERLFELQEAVRRSQTIRATQEERITERERTSVWRRFNRLFGLNKNPLVPSAALALTLPTSQSLTHSPMGSPRQLAVSTTQTDGASSPAALSPRVRRRELYREIRSHVWGTLGKRQVHGWSMPLSHTQDSSDPTPEPKDVPVLVQLRLLDQRDSTAKLNCAVAVTPEISGETTCAVWVVSGPASSSDVTVINPARSNTVLDQFSLPPTSPALCICAVPPTGETSGTVWIGTQEGSVLVHSASTARRRCLQSISLSEGVHSLTYSQGQVIAGLANGTLAFFSHNPGNSPSQVTVRIRSGYCQDQVGLLSGSDRVTVRIRSGYCQDQIGLLSGSDRVTVRIRSGSCQDQVRLLSGSVQAMVRIRSGSCQDQIRFLSGSDQDQVRLLSGSGQATVRIRSGYCQDQVRILSGSGQVTVRIRSGSGKVPVRIRSEYCQDQVRLLLGSGQDQVRFRSGSGQATVRIRSGSCQDQVRLLSGSVQAMVRIRSGSCQDQIRFLSGSDQDQVRLLSGSGQATVRIRSGYCQDQVRLLSGSGQVTVRIRSGSGKVPVRIRSGYCQDQVRLLSGSGQNTVRIRSGSCQDQVRFLSGSGQATVRIRSRSSQVPARIRSGYCQDQVRLLLGSGQVTVRIR
ncbi:C-Jun-amino-terminal kinase-interacting protein 3-like isoform X2 [Salvelinus fontinalis]|uniref:C-Jun-amino-terminal kinase-interacting protein 3-like isoform X2 n=1 Tax=Salvelinus fontinalis TaxID=8038 RepID=UPI002485ADF6|nr:C-Jun-amino-terminal kinase-interacting protein 3-like isoform X2 [Salvelinus fontinalis]